MKFNTYDPIGNPRVPSSGLYYEGSYGSRDYNFMEDIFSFPTALKIPSTAIVSPVKDSDTKFSAELIRAPRLL